MVSLSYSAPASTDNDPVFIRTHFLGRVASDASGLDYQHELLKRRSSRHSELNRWSANWLAPVTHTLSYDSDEPSSDTDDDEFAHEALSRSASVQQPRSRSSTLPLTQRWSLPVELTRARSMTAPVASSSSSDQEAPILHLSRSVFGSEPRLMPARPLSIDTAQPLRLPSLNVSTMRSPSSTSVHAPSSIPAVDTSSKTCSPPVVRIECSESDGSCHGDAGDQDPEAQLAAGIIRLREQRRNSSSSPKLQRRTLGSKRRSSMQSPRSASKDQPKLFGDVESDEAQSQLIRSHGGSFVLRLAEMALDFGSFTLEKLVSSGSDDSFEGTPSPAQLSPLEPRRRSSTTPKELNAEAWELLRRRRDRNSTVNSTSDGKATLTRSWSVPKLLNLPLFSPYASLQALSARTASTPSTPTGAPVHLRPDFGFTSINNTVPNHDLVESFDEIWRR